MDKLSYALGLGIGHQLSQMGAENLNIDDFAQAIKDVIAGNEPKVSNTEAQTIVQEFFQKQEEKPAEKESVPASVKEIFGRSREETEETDAEPEVEEKPVKKNVQIPEGYRIRKNDINTPTYLRNLTREINLVDDDED